MHDGKASVSFLDELFDQPDVTLERRAVLEMRMDGAFFREDVIDVLDAEGVQYAIKMSFYRWLGLKERIADCRYWEPVDESVECFERWLSVPAWLRRMCVVVYRKRVRRTGARRTTGSICPTRTTATSSIWPC